MVNGPMVLRTAFEKKRVLITGHTGFKGAWLSLALSALGAEVSGFSDGVPTQPALFEVLKLADSIADHRGDIRSFTHLQKLLAELRPDIIFHLAAQSLVRPGYDFPKETFDINVGGTVNLLEAVRGCPSVRAVVIVTSDKCYDARSTAKPFSEDDRLGGEDPYAGSKACAEIVFRSYAQSFFQIKGPAVASARAGNVVGGGDWAQDRLVPDCARSWSTGQTAVIRNPEGHRPWQNIFDITAGYLALAAQLLIDGQKLRGESFNFGPFSSENFSVGDVVTKFADAWGGTRWQPRLTESGLMPNGGSSDGSAIAPNKTETASFQIDSSKSRRMLAWQPRVTLAQSLNLSAEWYKNYYAGFVDMKKFSLQQIADHATIV